MMIAYEDPLRSALFTDLYQLTMAQSYVAERMQGVAAFELFYRKMPETRNYFVAAGLDDVLRYMESFQFTSGDLGYLRERGDFSEEFLKTLEGLRFSGDVEAVPEGTVVFPGEPLMRIVAPIVEAQLVETFALNQVHFQTLAATKASRVVWAASGRDVVDFGSRRAHGADAAMKVARTSFLVGAVGTSNVLAAKQYGIPAVGTMAHSYIQSHDNERSALQAFTQSFPATTLLVDTYDTLGGVRKVIELSREMKAAFQVQAIRLDSGDLAELARQSRQLLDEAGLTDVRIFVSGGLDEYKVRDLLRDDPPIDGFGVGTGMAVSDDAPSLDMAYKLIEYDGRGRMKLSSGKAIYPGRKQVFRSVERETMVGDVIGREDEDLPGERLLQPVMRGGRRLQSASKSLAETRDYAAKELQRLPKSLRGMDKSDEGYEVGISGALERHRDEVASWLKSRLSGSGAGQEG